MMTGRFYRDGTDAEDTYEGDIILLEFDMHFEIDAAGSRLEASHY